MGLFGRRKGGTMTVPPRAPRPLVDDTLPDDAWLAKSIDMLHTAYVFDAMRSRSPSAADRPILDGFRAALTTSVTTHPTASFDGIVREVTHRLRTISTACDAAGRDSGLYRATLAELATITPDVPVDDVFWT